MKIQSTRNYKQFKLIPGNRSIDVHHVNRLVKLNSVNNLMWQFPGNVTKDGYLWDGQHRLKACEANEWDFYYTVSDKTLEEMGDMLVPLTNTSQLKWKIQDYINWYARHGNEQYLYLEDLMERYNISHVIVLGLLKGSSHSHEIKTGKIDLYKTEDDKKAVELIIDGYRDLKGVVPKRIYVDSIFARALRQLFKYVSSQDIKEALDRAPMQLIPVRDIKDYLRQFEDIFNYGRVEKNHIRFF